MFINTINELKPFLKFNPLLEKSDLNYDVILFHEESLKNRKDAEIINKSMSLKICASNLKNSDNKYDAALNLPSTIKEINAAIENLATKKIFINNSSIKIKNYILNKNEKILSKENSQIALTEKEIQLLELFLKNDKPISKNKILSFVWHYSSDADTHTVETHIYRLRKKVNDKFSDENFIQNTKDGYSL